MRTTIILLLVMLGVLTLLSTFSGSLRQKENFLQEVLETSVELTPSEELTASDLAPVETAKEAKDAPEPSPPQMNSTEVNPAPVQEPSPAPPAPAQKAPPSKKCAVDAYGGASFAPF